LKTALLVLLWTLAVAGAAYIYAVHLWQPSVERGDVASLERYLAGELTAAVEDRRLGAAALVLIRGRDIVLERGFGVADVETSAPVAPDRTRFVVASVSKAVTAWGVMRLVEEGVLRLDEPVLPRLRRWRFPSSPAWRDRVTVRHLLAHTAGLDDGLGYGGFGSGERVQGLEASLSGAADSTVGAPREVVVAREPGTAMAYSGGGYAVLQLLVEEATGRPFAAYMTEAVLRPFGMTTASFDPDAVAAEAGASQLAEAYGAGLEPRPPRRYAALAPVALQATARDLARFAQAFTAPNPVLRPDTIQQMLTAQPATAGSWGLGHALFADAGAAGRIVGHDGGTPPGWGASVRVNVVNGDAFVLLSSGGGTLVTRLAEVWTYWEMGVVTAAARRQVLYDGIPFVATLVAAGLFVIVVLRWRRHVRST
jgi:CubicO group peptidase (beta-lactamase class C family)